MDHDSKPKSSYIPTIGIECHVQLNTITKLFVGVDNNAREADVNTLISPLCVGMPGSLPYLNEAAVELAVRTGLALNAEIAHYSKFDRKHYFYPDLPLGYQITQFNQPIILAGKVHFPLEDGKFSDVRIHHAHLETDAGKSTHPASQDYSLVDLNRAGTPLIEIVSEPDMHSPAEAKAFARELYLLIKYAGVSEADLFYGNMRFDVNVSVSNNNSLGTRTETKNLNSFRSVEKAVEYEVSRQISELEAGRHIIQETRGWDDAKQKTFSQRSKEDAHDYRYFPDPDLPPIIIQPNVIAELQSRMPLMPGVIRHQFTALDLDFRQIEALLDHIKIATELARLVDAHDAKTAKTIANWMSGELTRLMSDNKLDEEQIVDAASLLIELSAMLDGGDISSTAAKDLLEELVRTKVSARSLAEKKNLLQVSDESELEMIIAQVLSDNRKAADDVAAGEVKAIGFLVGQVMKASQGKANPGVVQKIIKQQLGVENND